MKWEYKVLIEDNNYSLRRAMNRLGAKGWEAYSVVLMDYTQSNIDPSVFEKKVLPTEVFFAYLKRPIRHGKRMPRHSR